MASQKAKILVVDSNAFIKAVRIERIGQQFYTVPQVVTEVRDVKARQFMENFPFEIKTREPTPAALKEVAAFARKTGDYPFLSAVDLRVLALVYTLESEAKGSTDHLRREPLKAGSSIASVSSSSDKKDTDKKDLEGAEQDKENDKPSSSTDNDTTTATTDSQPTTQNDNNNTEQQQEEQQEGEQEEKEEEQQQQQQQQQDDDDGWITPDNINEVRAKRGQEEDELKMEEVDVGCFTTDYAMQSVLLQMGLKLLSVDGMVIKKIRQYVLKCHSCFKICKDMERKFCPTCGNQTLLRFSASTDDQGNLIYTQAQRLNNRGTIFSIPLPKGGRNSKDLILTEDQYLQKTKWKKDKKDSDVFSSDYSFAQGRSGPNDKVVIGYGNKNPNVAKRRIGKKNKPLTTL